MRVLTTAAAPTDERELADEDEAVPEGGDDDADEELDAVVAEGFYADWLRQAIMSFSSVKS
ncbi:MAG: hypothetical protein JWR37_4660 [Mycobacterium sp.]|nr:hypothetical protein [Mycobacterium sp.]